MDAAGCASGRLRNCSKFARPPPFRSSNIFAYSPHPDGQRFLVNALVETGEPTVNVITNWQRAAADQAGRR